jgi:pimeloyl-ACP methyl ester carboxylesterase
MTLPLALTKLSYLIDNPWVVSQARADMAGLILADSLIDRNLGTRPVTLVGFSLGARVIFSCLKELSARGAFGLVQNVYMFGTPVVAKNDEYIKARSIVPGRFVNGYATNDWILGKSCYLHLASFSLMLNRIPLPCNLRRCHARRRLGSSSSTYNRKRQRD